MTSLFIFDRLIYRHKKRVGNFGSIFSAELNACFQKCNGAKPCLRCVKDGLSDHCAYVITNDRGIRRGGACLPCRRKKKVTSRQSAPKQLIYHCKPEMRCHSPILRRVSGYWKGVRMCISAPQREPVYSRCSTSPRAERKISKGYHLRHATRRR